MKSIRLNKDLRAEIASNIGQAYDIKNPEPATSNPDSALLDAVEVLFRKRANDITLKMQSVCLPLKHIKTTYYFQVATAAEYLERDFRDGNGNREWLPQVNPESLVLVNLTNIPEDDAELLLIADEYKEAMKKERPLRAIHTKWGKERAAYMTDVNNVLLGVNTTGQLLEVWAEVEKFLPVGIVNPSKINLPSVNIAELNKLI